MFRLEEAVSLQDCRRVIAICLAEAEKYHRVMWVSTYDVALPGGQK